MLLLLALLPETINEELELGIGISGYGWRADDGFRGKYYSGGVRGSEGYVFGEQRSCSSKGKTRNTQYPRRGSVDRRAV